MQVVFYLALEVWMDILVYPWICREKLGQFVARIGNRKFADILQFFLHDWGRHNLRELYISDKDSYFSSGAIQKDRYKSYIISEKALDYKPCDFAQTLMPEKIINFKQIQIECFDSQVLCFLHKIKPLFTNVLLDISARTPRQLDDLRTVLSYLMPMIGGIRAISVEQEIFDILKRDFAEKFAATKILNLHVPNPPENDHAMAQRNRKIPKLWNWLISCERGCDAPKLLLLSSTTEFKIELFNEINQKFHSANAPSTFAIFFMGFTGYAEFEFVNERTDEQLTGRYKVKNLHKGKCFPCPQNCRFCTRYFEICRYKSGAEQNLREWLEANGSCTLEYLTAKKCMQWIKLVEPKIGHIDYQKKHDRIEDEDECQGDRNEDHDDEYPSSAKKMRRFFK